MLGIDYRFGGNERDRGKGKERMMDRERGKGKEVRGKRERKEGKG